METQKSAEIHISRLGLQDVGRVQSFMTDVISRLPSPDLFAMGDEAYLLEHMEELGEIYGAFMKGALVAYTVLAFPGLDERNLAREFGVPEEELSRVAVLEATVVHETARGHGLQRRFHDLRERRARERGCLYLYSTVHPDNLPSIRNLEAAGLSLRFTRPMYGGKMRHCYAKRL
ncbi:GNAT family N-acetyltransferase [Paenibacillus methanolicus]|uniref:Acetyltransferase (GNAT) family protein n=1 Tax=Paenibacillus methanolicus TaxID=582686 RepID=A0A5S5C5U8_9BACL|nr:GNAT family N-acetyltransferase [Paenibacillus methanolicus]TYP74549.1 acetyltransferase (GNAT) family protein [Paenibacillus methanolicus]